MREETQCQSFMGSIRPQGDLNIFLTVFVSRAFVGRSRAFCLRWTAGTCCCCRWRGRAATAPPCPTSTSTTSFPASHRSARTQDASSKRWEQTHTHTECRTSLVLDFQNKSLHFLSLFHVQRCVFENVLTLRQSTAQRQADIIKSLSCFCPVPPSLLHLYSDSFDLLTPNPMNSGPGKFLSVFLTEASFLSPLI